MSANQSKSKTSPRWRFFRAGGLDQVRIETAEEIANLARLDQKLWVALSCPVKGLELDEKTLALIDSDKDGRVRANEVLEAIEFCQEALVDLSCLIKGGDALPLAALDPAKPAGKAALASAKEILNTLGKADAGAISLADVGDTAALFAKTRFNGDGVVTPESADDEPTKKAIQDAIASVGGVADRSGALGVDQARVDEFFAQLAAFKDWRAKAEGPGAAQVLPLGEKTAPAAAALKAVKAKVDDYFARCRLAAYDPRSLAALNRREEEYLAVAASDLSISASEIAGFPLARVEPGRPLPLDGQVNPAWSAQMAALVEEVLRPLSMAGRPALTLDEWTGLVSRFAPFEAWTAARPQTRVEALGLARVNELLASDAKAAMTALVAKDKSFEKEFDSIALVEKLVRYNRDLYRLLHNFVAFTDLYSPDKPAIFQAGTLFLDSRACELCVRVEDAGKHAALAALSKSYLVYCHCTRAKCEPMSIVAILSAGDADNVMVGRNGVFYDRKGRDWDATVTKIVDNPISVGEAFWAPYKRVLRYVEEQVAKRAAAADSASDARLTAAADTTVKAAEGEKPPEKVVPKKLDVGTLAAIGVAVGGVATVAGAMMQAFFGLGWLMPLGLIGLVLVISGPSMLIAALKLRQRNLGPLLDANGWAINGRVKINIPFGRSLTTLPELPPGSQRTLSDPYQDKRSPWPAVAAAVVVTGLVGYGLHEAGYLGRWLGYAPPAPAAATAPAAPPAAAPAATPAASASAVPN